MLATLYASFTIFHYIALRRNNYQAWQDEVRGMQKIVRDGVETNIQVLDAGEVRVSAPHLPSYSFEGVSSPYTSLLCIAVRQGGGVEYIMQPRIDRLSCQTYPLGGTAGPTAQAQRRRLLQASASAKLGMVSWACGNQHTYTLRLCPGFQR